MKPLLITVVGKNRKYKRCEECKSKLEKVIDKPGQYICKNGHLNYSAVESLTSTWVNKCA